MLCSTLEGMVDKAKIEVSSQLEASLLESTEERHLGTECGWFSSTFSNLCYGNYRLDAFESTQEHN